MTDYKKMVEEAANTAGRSLSDLPDQNYFGFPSDDWTPASEITRLRAELKLISMLEETSASGLRNIAKSALNWKPGMPRLTK